MTQKTANEVRSMEKAGRLVAECLKHVEKYIRAGITTNEIDQIVRDFILTNDAIPACLNYHGYPKHCCTSVNGVICHGVPDQTKLKDGDLINVDVTVIKEGFHGDHSKTFFVGNVSDSAKKITEVAFNAMNEGIKILKPGVTTGDIGFAIEKFVTRNGYHAVKELGGHGIGREFHEDPFVPSFGKKGRGTPLLPWVAITVEPMVNQTDAAVLELDIPGSDIKYYATEDGSLSAQFEHTVLITDTGHQILSVC